VEVLFRPIERSMLVTGFLVLGLNLVDAICTLRHVAMGAEELNPLMARLLDAGPVAFFVGKHLLASAGVLGILAYSHTRPARIALRWVLLPVYAAVAAYQVILFVVV
jgi:hypothetical protein